MRSDALVFTLAAGLLNEARWAGWNIVRAVVSVAAAGCLGWALVAFGRATS